MSYNGVIGNGESSKNFDLYSSFLGKTVGTNAVHRDLHRLFVCADPRMVSEAVNNRYSSIHTQ